MYVFVMHVIVRDLSHLKQLSQDIDSFLNCSQWRRSVLKVVYAQFPSPLLPSLSPFSPSSPCPPSLIPPFPPVPLPFP